MFKGSLVALITPFRDQELDEAAFQEHVAWQIGQGTHGLVPCGTTGESPALARRRAEAADRALRRGRQGQAGPGHRRNRHELDRAHDRVDPAGEGGGRRCGADRLPLLQQADAGRALSAFQGGPRLPSICRSLSTTFRAARRST